MQTLDWWVDRCRELLAGSQEKTAVFATHTPPPRLRTSTLWDSCSHAITYRWFNPLTEQGQEPAQQSWSAIVLDMLATAANR